MASDDKIAHLQEEAEKRKARLRDLKRASVNESSEPKEKILPTPQFRSYRPQDETLKEKALPPAKTESIEALIEDHGDLSKPTPLIQEIDLATLAPRKPDWDLKRDVSKKLEKLEKRTQRAIAELIRERLQANANEDLSLIVGGSNVQEKPPDSDED